MTDALINSVTLPVSLQVAPDFTGRLMVHIEKGTVRHGYRLSKNEFVASLESFIDAARSAGWLITPPPQMAREINCMAMTTLRAPEWIITQATKKLTQYRKRRISAKRTYRRGYLSLAVNPRWRLLSRNGGRDWHLMTHEKYNREIER